MNETTITADPGSHEVKLTRVFEAPRELVFDTSLDPDQVPSWWGPARLATTVEQMEARPGGRWRYLQRDSDGTVHGFHGVYHDVARPERIVQTFEYEGTPGHVQLTTTELEDLGGRTRLVQTSVFQSVEDRDAMVASGMESGARESMERLAGLTERRRSEVATS